MKTTLAMLFFTLVMGLSTIKSPAQTFRGKKSHFSLKTLHYELYGPSKPELEKAKTELDYAVKQFHHYFGEYPPKIAVVIFNSPDEIQQYDFKPFKERGLRYLPWVSSNYLQSGQKSVSILKDLGLVLKSEGRDKAIKVMTLLPIDRPEGLDLKPGDIIRTLNREPVGSLKAFEQKYLTLPVGSKVELGIDRKSEQILLSFPKPDSENLPKVQTLQTGKHIPRLQRREARPLSHEAGHMFFIAYVDTKLGKASYGEKDRVLPGQVYGHKLIPDWFDEAVATLCEFPALQEERFESMRKRLQERIPLSEFFVIEHPVASSQRELIQKVRAQQKHQTGALVIRGDRSLLPNPERAEVFYAQSLTLAKFIAEKESPAFIGTIAEGLMKGDSMHEILRKARSLPGDLAALEKLWVKWLEK